MPHTLGTVDGKHVAINKPPKSGSLYHNYKGFFSLNMLALVDADYKFIWVYVGHYGSNSDSQLFLDYDLRQHLEARTLRILPVQPLVGDTTPHTKGVPYFIVGDDAFSLGNRLMKPYSRRDLSRSERLFNYRVSLARRVVENAFVILANCWHYLLSYLQQRESTTTTIITSCILLHNMMRIRYPALQDNEVDTEGIQQDAIAVTWTIQQAHMSVMQQRLPPHEGTNDT